MFFYESDCIPKNYTVEVVESRVSELKQARTCRSQLSLASAIFIFDQMLKIPLFDQIFFGHLRFGRSGYDRLTLQTAKFHI
jgi:hypothetical protein